MIVLENLACGLPDRIVTNDELRATHGWDLDRLEKRTGVTCRRVAADGETALDLALRACRQLEAEGRLRAQDIDGVIFCTQTPDHILTPNSCILHQRLGLRAETLAFDFNLACSGYVYGLRLASSLIDSGAAQRILFVTADTYSRVMHPRDRASRSLFGDGAAVSILSRSMDGRGIRAVRCWTAGEYHQKVWVPAGGTRLPRSAETCRETTDESGNVRDQDHLQLDGFSVLSFFNMTIPAAVKETLAHNGLSMEDVDLFVFHQASQVALDFLRRALAIPAGKFVCDLTETGNLVSASIPVALSRALASGQAKRGQLALLCGFGVGFSWGTALVDL